MPEVIKAKIIRLLKHADYVPLAPSKLAKELGIAEQDYRQFKTALEQLRQVGHVVVGARDLVYLPPLAGTITGTFKANQKGFGFVIPHEPMAGDLFIPAARTTGAMTGDTVVAKVEKKKGSDRGQVRYSGRILEILERANNRFVGTLLKTTDGWVVQPDGSAFTEPVIVTDVTAKSARQKDKVVIEILSYPTEKHLADGVIIEVLGRAGHYDTEIKSIIHQYHFSCEFDEDCLAQARQVAQQFNPDQLDSREDITDKIIITIDPKNSKDFDDAISLEKDKEGRWVLGVHIADVSYFVYPDTALDAEAHLRGNSVYLPGKTIPMLPEVLSNGICSLQPDQERFVKSVYTTYDQNGKILSRRFANSVMKSTQRLTYIQANRILNGHTKDIKSEIIELLKDMETLSRLIEQRRIENEMLHLDLPEIQLVFDKAGRVIDSQPADTSYPHTMIEMFMVEANEAVASLFDRLNVDFMRRIHPEPDSLSMKNLSQFARAVGLNIPRTPDRKALQTILAAVKDKDCSLAVNLMVLRSLEKALYSPLNVGHFALASRHYCHFTSPIRRYADLLVHRVLDLYLKQQLDSAEPNQLIPKSDLKEIGNHIAFTEQQAKYAESELKTVLILQMLSDHIGDLLDCIVTGLASFGVFVQCKKFGIEGLIRLENLGADVWRYNSKTQCLIGKNSGCMIGLGRALKVRIVSIDIPARQLNLAPAEPLVKASVKKNKIDRKSKSKYRNRKRK